MKSVARTLPASAVWLFGALAAGLAIGYLMNDSPDGGTLPRETAAPSASRAAGDATDFRRPRRVVVRPQSERDYASQLREIESLAAASPAKARAKLDLLGDDAELRVPALEALARGWALHDPEAAAAWIESLPDEGDQVAAAGGLVAEWASSNPDACLAWNRSLAHGVLREMSLVDLADSWVSRDPVDAFATFSALDAEDGVERGLHAITADWVLDDADSALRHLAALGTDQRRDEFLETALVSLTNEDPERSWRQADMVPERSRHIRAMALEAIAENNPERALAMAGAVEQAPAAWWKAIGRGWSYEDPVAATAWARTIGDPELRTVVLDEIESGAE